MTNSETQFYDERIAAHGEGLQSLGYLTPERQLARFHSVLKYLRGLRIQTVLDFGCGRGDFLPFIALEFPELRDYVGWDIMPQFIEAAEKRFPSGPKRVWHCGDYLSENVKRYDAILCIDTFTQGGKNKDSVFSYFHNLIMRTERVFVATLLSSYASGIGDELKFSPHELIDFCDKCGYTNYAIDNLTLPYNLTFVVYPSRATLTFTGTPDRLGRELS